MSKKEKTEILKNKLLKTLQDPEPDYGELLNLAGRLARQDTENVRFFTDASLIERLGRELVVKQETAVTELVKNAYDADATTVKLRFEDVEEPGGRLTIEDDGNGMSRKKIINGFMRLSTTDKIHNPISPKYNRQRAGRKGIGRFAAQRLGRELTIISQAEGVEYAQKVEIDWSLFTGDTEIFSIANRIQDVEPKEQSGTILIIDDLEEAWTVAQLERVYRYLIDLIQPFPLSETEIQGELDPGFEITIERIVDNQSEQVASAEKLVYKHALAEIEGFVDNEGRGGWAIQSNKLDIDETYGIGKEKDDASVRFEYLKNINLKAYYYIYLPEYIPKNYRGVLLDLADNRGGVRVYRNGFRILPYGEPYDDWLKLDEMSSRRQILPPSNSRNFFGFVELIDTEKGLFEETASREGLIENDAFRELVDFTNNVLVKTVFRIAEARERKKKPVKREEQSPEERIKRAARALEEKTSRLKSPNGTADDTKIKEAQDTVQEILDAADEQAQEKTLLLEELGMLRILASLGLTIGEFTHEVKQLIPSTLADANHLKSVRNERQKKVISDRLIKNLKNFKTYTSIFDRAVSQNTTRETEPQELGRILRTFWKVMKPSCDRYGIEFPEPDIQGYDLYTAPMHPSEWISILFNLFTNSHKAIERAGVKPGKIFVASGRDDNKVFVKFCDNGDGISPEYRERIFDAFFTTSTPAKPFADEVDETDSLTGSGLGLKIIKDIITSYNGEISLMGAPRGYSTCFFIELPAATDEELETYDS